MTQVKRPGTSGGYTNHCTPELLAMMIELLPTVGSLRDLCAVTGLRLETVRRETAPFLAIMKLQGTHPQCGCGKDRFHPYGCADSYAKGKADDYLPGHSRERSAVLLERREAAIKMLVAGDRLVDIDLALGMPRSSAKSYQRFLTEAQRAARQHALERRQSIVRPRRRSAVRTARPHQHNDRQPQLGAAR